MEQRKTEPWKIGAMESGMVAIDSNDGEEVTGFIDPEYASRILACVNACAGFSNDELEGANLHKDSIDAQNEIDDLRADLATAEQDSRQKQARIDRLERERDELIAALEDVKIYFQDTQSQLYIYDRVTKCVASVKGGAS